MSTCEIVMDQQTIQGVYLSPSRVQRLLQQGASQKQWSKFQNESAKSNGYGELFISQEMEKELIRRAQTGCRKSRNRLIESQLPFINLCAIKCVNLGGIYGLLDYVSEGSIGLAKAIDAFDLNQECRLQTFAVKYVYGPMLKLYNTKVVTGNVVDENGKYKKFIPKISDIEKITALNNDSLSHRDDSPVSFNDEENDSFEFNKDFKTYINLIPEKYIRIVKMHYLNEMTFQEIGDKVGESKQSVHKKIIRAMNIAQERYQRQKL
jgi:RNA polymerase sigma factor (sigma-70 family)